MVRFRVFLVTGAGFVEEEMKEIPGFYRNNSSTLYKGAFWLEDKKSNINKVTVQIFGEEYVVKGPENPDYIEMLASYVDRRMFMIHQRNPNLSTSKVAVLTALNLADELNKLQEDYDDLVKALEEERKNRMG